MNQNNNENSNGNNNVQTEQKQFYMVEAFLPENLFQERIVKYLNKRKKDSTKFGKNGIDEHFLMGNGAELFLFQNYKTNEGINFRIFSYSIPSYHERGIKALEKVGKVEKQEIIESLDGMLKGIGVLKPKEIEGNRKYASFNLPSETYS